MPEAVKIFEGISEIDIRLKPREYSAEVLRVICENLGYDFGTIILTDEEGKGSIFSSHKLPETYPYLVHKAGATVLSSPSGAAVETGKPQVVNDIIGEPRLTPWCSLLTALKIQTIVWVPLFSKGKAFGTYNLYDRRKRDISQKELEILTNLSMLFSMAIMSNEYIDEIREKSLELEKEIVDRKKAERELRIARDTAETANKVKDEFLTTMSHELRTPMNAIMGFTEILMLDEEDPGKLESLNIVRESGETLLYLINGILDFTEIESGNIHLVETSFSLVELMEKVYSRYFEWAEKKKIIFELKNEPTVPARVQGDEHRIEQVVTSIVDNAIKFTAKGRVRVSCGYDDEIAVIRVEDTGIGIPPEKQETVFSVFYQADMTATREHQGVGLGLTIASRLVDRMGGGISLKSEPGVGSTFTVELPLPRGG